MTSSDTFIIFYMLEGVQFTHVVSTTRCIYTCPVLPGMRPRPPHEGVWAIIWELICNWELLQNAWPGENNPYIFFSMLFFIKTKLSSRLCLTPKIMIQNYRNSTLIKKKNLRWYQIRSELADTGTGKLNCCIPTHNNVLLLLWDMQY